MSIIKKELEMRGMRRSEILAYFKDISNNNSGPGKFKGPDWEVEVGEENCVSLGSIKIPSITVKFCGEKEPLDELTCTFRLKFLSAGG